MKKTANKQKKRQTLLKKVLVEDGRKLKWLSETTRINYQRLQRIVNQGYEPTLSEATRIAAALKRSFEELFPAPDLPGVRAHSSLKNSIKRKGERWGSLPQGIII